MQTFTIRIFRTGLLGAMLWLLLPLAFLSCDRPDAEVDISLSSDYRGIAEAIRGGGQTLAETLSLIEAAVAEGFADQAAAQQLLQEAVAAMGGMAGQKLSLIEAAVKSQAAGLETKLGLIEAAAAGGFADAAAQRALIATAIASVAGEAGEQLAAVETAVQGQTASLSMKLGLIETAVKEGLADEKAGWELLQKALDALGEEAAGRLAAIAEAMVGQAASLSAKLDLLTMAIEKGLADQQAPLAWVRQAVEALDGTVDEKLAAVDSAVQRQPLALEAKLEMIEAAVVEGFADAAAQQALLRKAIDGLGGTAETKLAAIEAAVKNQAATLSSKLGLIETAVAEGFEAADKLEEKLIKDALDALSGTTAEKLGAIDTAMMRQTASLATKLGAIQQTYKDSLANAREALELIETAVVALDTAATDVLRQLHSIEETSLERLLVEGLTNIRTTIQGVHDYSTILAAIEAALEDLNIPLIITFDPFFVTAGELVMGEDTTLRIPFQLSSADLEVKATASSGIRVAVERLPNNPLEGYLVIEAGTESIGASSQVELTVSSSVRSQTRQLKIVKEQMKDPTGGQDLTLNYEGKKLDGTTGPFEFHYTTNTPTIVTVPDTATWVHLIYDADVSASTTDSVIRIVVDPNMGFYARQTGVKITNHVSKNALTFSIYQDYNKEEITFSADNSSLKTAFVLDTKHINFNKDGIISKAEAAAVTSLDSLFGPGLYNGQLDGHKCEYTSFDEFQYFTGIDTIPAGSFHNWVNLTSITLPSSITTIEGGHDGLDGPFTECPKLEAIKGPFTVNDQMLVYNKQLLKVAETTTSVTIPAGVEIIGTKAFYKSNVKSITIPSSVKRIRDHAFEYSQVETVAFAMTGTDPQTATAYVDSLAETSFVHCFKLKSFKGPENGTSTVRVTRDRLCLCRDTTLYAFAMGSGLVDYAIPESAGVKKLAAYVFSAQPSTSSENPDPSAVQWQKIGLPSTLTHVGDHAFSFQKATPRMEVFFKGENPPKADAGVFDNTSTKRLMVPPVKNGGQVDLEATSARGHQFENAMGGDNYFSPSYYDVWPFAEGIPMVATIAAKQGYVCESNPGSSIPGQWSDLGQDTVAVLYTVEGVNKRAHARVAAVDANGVATISFVVDYKTTNVASNIDCQLVYPPRAVNDANTGPKDYHVMSDSQTGDESKSLDVQVGSGSFNTAGTPSLTINTPLHPIYSLFIIKLNSGNETELSVKDKDNNPVVTMDARLGVHGRDTYYFSMPASNTNSMYHISGSNGQCSISVPTSSSYTQPTPLGYVFPFTVTLQ